MGRAAATSFLACLLCVAGCDDGGWWCHTAEYADDHDEAKPPYEKLLGKRKCYRLKEYCSGTCTQLETAYCFDVGRGVHAGGIHAPPDRNCYATPEICSEARREEPAASSNCRGAQE